jgi:hypothetical protein
MSNPFTAAGEIARELLQVSLQESIDSLSHGLRSTAKKNIDSHLAETHERPHAHSTRYEDLYPVLSKMIDRGHAPALLVGHVR